MKDIVRDIFYSIITGIALYIVGLLFSSIAFINVNNYLYMLLFFAILLLGCFVLIFGLQYHCKHITRKMFRFLFILLFYLCFFVSGAYLGVTRWYFGLFYFEKFDPNNNVSGLFSLIFFLVIISTGFLILLFCSLWKIAKNMMGKRAEK